MRRAAALALASLLPLTAGCIAAVVPLAAGAALVKTRAGSDDSRADAPVPLAAASARGDLKVLPTSLTALPAPDPALAAAGDPAILAFRRYALEQAGIRAGTSGRTSAIISTPSELRPMRAGCGAGPAAVFVDLDPGRGTFDPLAPGQADPALGAALAALRERGIGVIWFSRLGANLAAAARAALVQGGLDPAGQDELILMRDIGERKQSLRDAAAKRVCPIAILGDERADFDELYLYLKNPDAAIGLEAMVGRGWFLASPFAAETAIDAGAAP